MSGNLRWTELFTCGRSLRRIFMRNVFFALALAGTMILPGTAFSQQIELGPDGVRVGSGRGGQCEQLRRACENKGRLGEQGEGNCRRYRETCQRPSRAST